MIAYENALKVERGPAVGSAVLGTVMLAVVMGLPFWLIGFLFMAGYSAIALLFYHTPTYKDVSTKEAPAIVSSPLTPTTGVVAQTTPMVAPPAQVAVASPTARPVQQPVSKPVAKKKKPKKPAQTASATVEQVPGNQDQSSASGNAAQPAQMAEAQPTPTHTDVVDDAADAAKKALGF